LPPARFRVWKRDCFNIVVVAVSIARVSVCLDLLL
jgi:hypothetical protein